MTKKRKRRSRPGVPHPFRDVASTEATTYPDITSSPEALDAKPSTEQWIPEDSTSVPEIGEESETAEPLAGSQWALIDKYIIRKKLIHFVIVIIVIGWIIIQDNGAGKLTDWKAIWWTLQKCFVFLGLYGFIFLIQGILQKFFKK